VKSSTDDIILPYDVYRGILGPTGTTLQGLVNVLVPEGMDKPVEGRVVTHWREKQSEEVIALLDELFPILDNPRWVSRISIVNESEGFLTFMALRGDRNPDKPVWVCSYDSQNQEIRVTRLPTLIHFARYLTYYITPGFPLSGSNLGLSIPGPSFLILCAIADLIRRRLYTSRLNHTTLSHHFTRNDILEVIGEAGGSKDLRWLLPHIFSLLPYEPLEYLKGDLASEFSWLEGHEYLLPGENNGEYISSDSCMNFLKLLNSSTCRQGIIKLRREAENGVIMESACFIRVPRAIFAINIGNDTEGVTAVLTTLNFEQLLEFTIEFLHGTDIPPGPAPSYPENPRTSSSAASHVQKITCPHCNAPLPSSAKFCRKCGNPINRETP
jgi:hypothetical protein